ncbi:MAG TPA: aminopeptidase [Candidatus Binatia bacterium]
MSVRARRFSRYLGVGSFLRRRYKQLFWLAALSVAIAAILPGCSPLYVLRAAYEEGKILWRREPITDFVASADVQADTQEKLKLVLAVRKYARDVLKFNVGGSYSSYSRVDRPDLTYIVMAAPKTELKPYTWWFLIIGNVPYKGFFSREEAEAEIARLKAQNYDTMMRTSAAFSTLGWFDDPLLSHLLRYDKVGLAGIIFHELFHNTLYVNGAGAFNESAANFVGNRAAIDFFRDRFGAESKEYARAVQIWDHEREFGRFINQVADTLRSLYRSDIPRADKLRLREEVFARSQEEWQRYLAEHPDQSFRRFSQRSLNNAVLMNYLVYLTQIDMFESLYGANGNDLTRTVEAMRSAVAKGRDPFEAVHKWLDKHRQRVAATAD